MKSKLTISNIKSGQEGQMVQRSELNISQARQELDWSKNGCPAQPVRVDNMSSLLPEFGRWRDVERLFGIKRGTLYNLVAEGKIKSVSMRRKGNVHGCRLFHLASISQYLNGLLTEQQSLKIKN